MEDLIIFIGSMVTILLGLFIYIMSRVGFSYSALSTYIKKIENKSVLKAAGGIMGAMLAAAFIVFLLGQTVKAEEGKWLDKGSVFIGIEYQNNGSVFCRDTEGGINNSLVSNLGANIEVYSYGDHSFSGNYTHHSCVVNPDINVYDAVGFKYIWRIW